jgi:hypothetical protein
MPRRECGLLGEQWVSDSCLLLLLTSREGKMRARVQLLLLAAALIISAKGVHADVITETVGPTGANFTSLGAAAAAEVSTNSYIINMASGTYTNDFAVFNAATTLNATGVTIMTNEPPPNQKGVLTTIFPLTVNGLSLIGTPDTGPNSLGSGIPAGAGGNSSAIREQANGANTLTVNNALIEGFQMGILTSSDSGKTHLDQVTISNTKFINNGNPDPSAFGHALYVGDAASLTVTGSLFCGQVIGHDIKSRAAQTTVTGSTMFVGTNSGAPAACNVGSASLAIDMPNGGQGTIDMNQIFQGDANQNGSLIRFGEEGLVPTFVNSLSVTNTTFDNLGTRASIGIDELKNCSAPVSGVASDTFTNVGTHVNPAGCVSAAPAAAVALAGPALVPVVPEPRSLALLSSALMALFLVRRRTNG